MQDAFWAGEWGAGRPIRTRPTRGPPAPPPLPPSTHLLPSSACQRASRPSSSVSQAPVLTDRPLMWVGIGMVRTRPQARGTRRPAGALGLVPGPRGRRGERRVWGRGGRWGVRRGLEPWGARRGGARD